MNPQIQVNDAFGVHLHWPDEGQPSISLAPASWDGATFVTCPHCGGQQVIYHPPVCVGEPQPEEWEPCPLCDGIGDVLDTLAARYRAQENEFKRA